MDKIDMPLNSFREILQICRNAVNELNGNSIVTVLRKQSERFEQALDIIERTLSKAENVLEDDSIEIGIKAATAFIIGLWSKLRHGVTVDNLTDDELKSIINHADKQVAAIDPKDYSLLVFDLYRKSIAYATESMGADASPSVVSRLEEIVLELESSAEDLKSGALPEVRYIEENLWLCLEAVFLIMTDKISRMLSNERQELVEAVGGLVFQMFRYSLYDRELEVVDECLKYQGELDQRLTEQVSAFIDQLNHELDEFDSLVEKAFDTNDFQAAFRGSIILAKSLGVKKTLQTKEDIDEYFMS